MLLGCDVSFRQGEVDWVAAARELRFAYIRAGQREDWHDSQFPSNWRESHKANIPRGFYWVWDQREGADAQAHARGVQQVVLADDRGELPPAVDLEVDPVDWDELLAFLQWLEGWAGRRPIIYTGSYFVDRQNSAPEWLRLYDYWATGYNDVGPELWGKLAALEPNVVCWQQANDWGPEWIEPTQAVDRDYWLTDLKEYIMGDRVLKVSDVEQLIRDKAFDVEQPAPPVPPPTPGGPFRLIWPAPLPAVITQQWGKNPQHYSQFGLKGHEGVDIRAVTGAQIVAAAAGIVSRVQATVDGGAYGIHVRINHDHPDGQFETISAHFKQVLVSLGDAVEAGQIIGLADNTGNSSGAHLHLSLKKRGNGSPWLAHSDLTDPTVYLSDIFPGNGWRIDIGSNLRTGPVDTFPIIRYIAAGPTVRATGRFAGGGDWWEIEHQGQIGWVWAVYKMGKL